MMSRVSFRALWCPSGDGGKKETSCGQIQFLFSWLAGFSVTHWLRELDFPGTGSSASHGRSRNHQHERIKVFEKMLWVQILGFVPPRPLSPFSFLFFFFLFWLVIHRVWFSAPRRGSMAGSQGLRRPLPQARLWLQVAGCSAGGIWSEAGTPSCQIPDLCHTSAATHKNNHFVK